MSRKIQLVAFILGMLLVGVERFTAQRVGSGSTARTPVSDGGIPIPIIRR